MIGWPSQVSYLLPLCCLSLVVSLRNEYIWMITMYVNASCNGAISLWLDGVLCAMATETSLGRCLGSDSQGWWS